jgi:glycosyltransferase involved in cell wall biosynthesis
MATTKVSVIVPNYNHAKYLPERLDSILNQTFKDFELIVLDDCSSDQSREVILDYQQKHPWIQTVFNNENSGSTFAQWNKGATLARGDYLWIAESDDAAHPELLSTLVPLLEAHPNVGIAFAQSMLIDAEGREMHSFLEHYQFVYQSDRWERDFLGKGATECAEYLMYHNTIPNASGALFRKSAYWAAGGAEPGWKLNGDWFFYVKVLLQSDLAFVAQHLNFFRMHTQTQRQKANANARVYDELIETLNFIEANVSVRPEVSKEAWRRVSGWWAGSLYRQTINKTFFTHNWRLYRYFSKKRPRLGLNILSNAFFLMVGKVLEVLGIKAVVKAWRARLFPKKYFKY